MASLAWWLGRAPCRLARLQPPSPESRGAVAMKPRRLYIMRHGKSDWGATGLADRERDLAQRGRRDSQRMGELLAERGLTPDRIIASPAKRARLTAKLVARACGYGGKIGREETLYYGEAERCVSLLCGLADAWRSVLVVGHNPGLEELVGLLTGESVKLTTANVAAIDLPVEDWADLRPHCARGVLRFVLRPKESATRPADGSHEES